jgi:hypothetical protein
VRKLFLALLAAGLVAVAAPVVLAGTGPRLNGSFKTVATIHGNDLGIADGTKTNDVFKFTSRCPSGACARVKLDRDGGNHKHYKSTLRKVKPGVYKGTEGPFPYTCANEANSTFTTKHTIRVTKTKDGKATAFGGTSKVTITNCSFVSFVNYTLKGTLGN